MAARIPEALSLAELDEAKRITRAQRINEMLARWDAEGCADEPDWDVNDILPARFGSRLPPQAPDEAP